MPYIKWLNFLGNNAMSDLRELYQEVIIDHGRHPRNFSALPFFNHTKEGYNPLCGDRLTIYLVEENNVIKNISFQGSGCAISMASASLMTESVKGKTIEEMKILFDDFHSLVKGEHREWRDQKISKLAVLSGVSEFPMRVKCATLCWHTLIAAIKNSEAPVTTE